MERQISKVEFYDPRRGYGKTKLPDGRSVFLHWSEIKSEKSFKCLFEDDEIEFTLITTPKGLRATNIIKINQSGEAVKHGSEKR